MAVRAWSTRSGCRTRLRWLTKGLVATSCAVLAWAGAVPAAEQLVAPVYPGAVPAVTGKAPGGEPHDCEGRCFLTKDPIEKVKAFYDKAIGPLKQAPQPYGQRSYGRLMEKGPRTEEGTPIAAMGIHALGPALTPPADPAKSRQAYETGSLGWNPAWGPIHHLIYMTAWTPEMSNPLMNPYKPADVSALATRYNRTQTYFYVLNAASGKTRANVLADGFSERLGRMQQEAMTGNLAAQQNVSQQAAREGDKLAAQDAQDDPEFNRIMQRKPALQKKYVALSQKMQQQMLQGKYDEADQTAEEADRLLRSDPEMAALMKRYDERDRQRDDIGAKAAAQGSAAEGDVYARFAKQAWDSAVATLDQLVKEGFTTFIVIDYRLGGSGVNRDSASLAAQDDGLHDPPRELSDQASRYRLAAQELGIKPAGDTPEQAAAAREAARPSGATPPTQAAAPSAGQQAPAQQAPAPPAEKKDNLGEAAKRGFNALKKLF